MNNLHLGRLFYAHYNYINLVMLLCVHLMDCAEIEAAFEETACGSTVGLYAAASTHPLSYIIP